MRQILTILMTLALLSSCEKLGGNEAFNDVICGMWTFDYETSEELDVEFGYDHIIFNADGTCALTYDGGQLEGTYRADDSVIAIDSDELPDGKPVLWRIVEFSPYKIVADYVLQREAASSITIVIRLEKVRQ